MPPERFTDLKVRAPTERAGPRGKRCVVTTQPAKARAPKSARRTRPAAPSSRSGASAPSGRTGLWLGVLLFALTVLLYLPSWQHGRLWGAPSEFIWDDDAMVWNNPLIKEPDGLWRFWATTEAPDYFPLVSSLLWVQWRLWGMNPAGYHFVQALLHAGAAVLLWRVLRRLSVPGAWWAGLVFAVHPVNVETVAWITETKNTLPMVLYLASLLAYARFDESGRRREYALSFALFVLALLGKTSVVMLPFVLLGIAWWRRGRIARADLVRSVPFFAASLVLGLVTVWFQSHRAIISTVIREDSFASRLAIAGRAVWFYLSKALVPLDLCFVYPRWSVDPASPLAWVPLAALLAVFGAAWWKRAGWGRPVLAVLGYFTLSLLPVLGFVNIYFMRYSLVADHWQYVAIAGVIAGVAGAAAHATRRLPRQAVMAGGGSIALVLAGLSWSHQSIFVNNERLFRDVLSRNPEAWIAHNNLGWILFEKGKPEEALGHYKAALALKPDLADAHRNLGILYMSQQRDAEAAAAFEEALRQGEDHRAHDALGVIRLRQGRAEEALAEFEKAVRLKPDFAPAHVHRGEYYAERKDWARAASAFAEAVRLAPSNPDSSNALARALASAGRPDEAAAELRRILAVRPDYVPGYLNLASLLAHQGRHAEAVSVLREARRLQPGNPEIQAELARLGDQ